MSEFDSLRSMFTVLGSTMLCNTSVTASELGGIVPMQAIKNELKGIVLRLSSLNGDNIYRVKFCV